MIPRECIELKIDNVPDLSQFIDINNQFLKRTLNYLGEFRPVIDDFIAVIQELRIELCNAINTKKQKQEHHHDYYYASLPFFTKHFLASIERLLQGHVSYAFMHCRVAVESSIILYLHCKGDITFDEIENGKHKELDERNLYKKFEKTARKLMVGDNNRNPQLYKHITDFFSKLDQKRLEYNKKERRPINIYQYFEQFRQDMAQPEEQRKYPLIREETLKFFDDTSEYAIHPNYLNIMLAPEWVSYPITKEELHKFVQDILGHMLICLSIYIEVYGGLIEFELLKKIITKWDDLGSIYGELKEPPNQ